MRSYKLLNLVKTVPRGSCKGYVLIFRSQKTFFDMITKRECSLRLLLSVSSPESVFVRSSKAIYLNKITLVYIFGVLCTYFWLIFSEKYIFLKQHSNWNSFRKFSFENNYDTNSWKWFSFEFFFKWTEI